MWSLGINLNVLVYAIFYLLLKSSENYVALDQIYLFYMPVANIRGNYIKNRLMQHIYESQLGNLVAKSKKNFYLQVLTLQAVGFAFSKANAAPHSGKTIRIQ